MFTHEPDDYSCPFCNYVAGGSDDFVGPEHVVERTAHTLTYVSPRWWVNNPGNVLVIPRDHIENLYVLPDDVAGHIHGAARRVAIAMKHAYGCDGVSTRQHNEPGGNQEVWHYHLHVFPRWHGDNFYGTFDQYAWADWSAMAERADQLRAALPQP